MKKVVIAIDSFKGSLSSCEVADAFEQGFRPYHPECYIRKVSIADGGEGTLEALIESRGGDYIEASVCDPLLRPIKARYGIIDGTTAIIEMARASGLPLLKEVERNPLVTTSFGTGEMVADAVRRGCRRILLGIGGSATTDAGVGMLQALGFRFLDHEGAILKGGGEILERIATIDDSNVSHKVRECKFVVACDVTNPLYGPNGAAYIFAPQKGADAKMVEQLDRGLRNFALAVERYNGVKIGDMEGAGAAGGMGGGIKALLNGELVRGIDMILDAMHFADIIEGADLVVTGEGRIDYQTLLGKAPSGVLAEATKQGIPTIAIGGCVEWCDSLRTSHFHSIEVVTPEGVALSEAMKPEIAKANIIRVAGEIAQRFSEK